jgi:hypothetical protein
VLLLIHTSMGFRRTAIDLQILTYMRTRMQYFEQQPGAAAAYCG